MNPQPRKVTQVVTPQTVLEGAGVRLKRSMPSSVLDYVDPFLLFDHFGSSNPADCIRSYAEKCVISYGRTAVRPNANEFTHTLQNRPIFWAFPCTRIAASKP
jgi:hypothetical protein